MEMEMENNRWVSQHFQFIVRNVYIKLMFENDNSNSSSLSICCLCAAYLAMCLLKP